MLFENSRFTVTVGVYSEQYESGVLKDPSPQYLVTNKETGVVEFINSSLYFVRDWAVQMTEAMDKQDAELAAPTKQEANVLPFPSGGGNGRSN